MSEEIAVFQQDTNGDQRIVVKSPDFADFYKGIANQPFDEKASTVLLEQVNSNDVEIRPDGLIYLPEIKYRRILNQAFGVGAWSLIQMQTIIDSEKNAVFYDGCLFINGRYHARATGEQKYIATNDKMTWATALEGAKSDCLTRCCKDLGIASDLWNPPYIKRWIEANAVSVFVQNKKTNDKKVFWRKINDPKYDVYPWVECGVVNNKNQGHEEQKQEKPKQQENKTNDNLHQLQKKIGLALVAICDNDKDKASQMLLAMTKSDNYKGIDSVSFIKSEKQAYFLLNQIKPKYSIAFDWNELDKNGKVVSIEDAAGILPENELPFDPTDSVPESAKQK